MIVLNTQHESQAQVEPEDWHIWERAHIGDKVTASAHIDEPRVYCYEQKLLIISIGGG